MDDAPEPTPEPTPETIPEVKGELLPALRVKDFDQLEDIIKRPFAALTDEHKRELVDILMDIARDPKNRAQLRAAQLLLLAEKQNVIYELAVRGQIPQNYLGIRNPNSPHDCRKSLPFEHQRMYILSLIERARGERGNESA